MRYEDWQKRFWMELDRARERKWQWGTHDCVSFAARMADVISDRDYIIIKSTFKWNTPRQAAELLKNTTLKELMERALGPAMDWRFAKHGDLVLACDETNSEVLTVHDGLRLLCADKVGYCLVDMKYAQCAWRII